MIRRLAIAVIGSVLLGCLPAQAQEQDMPELDGAPGPLRIPRAAPVQPKPAPPKITRPKAATQKVTPSKAAQLKATQDQLARQAEAQKAEAARLAQQAADLQAREAALDTRAAGLAATEKRLASQRTQQEAALAAKEAELDRKLAAADRPDADEGRQYASDADASPAMPPGNTQSGRRLRSTGVDLAAARRSCIRAATDEARARDYFSARYDTEPRFNQRTGELRGLMRLEDRRGYRIIDSVCELDANGEAEYVTFLR
jgi:chromosome segregation ATPase